MKIINGIAYANQDVEELLVTDIKLLDDMIIIVTFNTNEERLFDVSTLFHIPIYEVLKDDVAFNSCKIVNGNLTWLDGELDIANETMYNLSFKYDKIQIC